MCPHLMFLELKIAKILKSSGWGMEKSKLHGNIIFCSHSCASCRTITLLILGWMYDIISHLKLQYLWNLKTMCDLKELYTWVVDLVLWYWSVDTLSIDINMDNPHIKDVCRKPRLHDLEVIALTKLVEKERKEFMHLHVCVYLILQTSRNGGPYTLYHAQKRFTVLLI